MYTEKHSDNYHKRYVRTRIAELLARTGKHNLNILTLTHLNYDLELNLIENGHRVTIVEVDKQIHTQHEKDIGGTRGLKLKHDSVANHLRNKDRKYDFAYLDFCGSLSTEVHEILVNAKINVMFLVLSGQRETHHPQLYKRYTRNDVHTNIFETCGFKSALQLKYDNIGTPMLVYLLIREKQLKIY